MDDLYTIALPAGKGISLTTPEANARIDNPRIDLFHIVWHQYSVLVSQNEATTSVPGIAKLWQTIYTSPQVAEASAVTAEE